MSFDTLGLDQAIVKAVTASGYTEPTPVQAKAIPAALEGHDLLVSAATGSGKTAAFILPSLQMLQKPSAVRSIGPRVLVLTPTRELAMQVTKSAETYSRNVGRVRVVSVVGGMPYPAQIRLLKQPVDILVATPGRLLDYIGRGRIDFSRVEMFVLDEADRMLDMGFIEDIEEISRALPEKKQIMMFSATFSGPVGRLAEEMVKEPQHIELATHRDRHDNIEQRLHFADNEHHKSKLLEHMLRGEDMQQAIVFASTKRDTETIADNLSTQGFSAAHLHGDMPQNKRNRTLAALRRGDVQILVATDVAARGIDVPNISHVFNYGMPMRAEDYVHRIGRTGRAGRNGVAVTLAGPAERGKVRAIERFTTQRIEVHTIAGLEPKVTAERRESRGGFGGKPRSGGGFRSEGRSFGDRGAPRSGGGYRGGQDRPSFGGHHNGSDTFRSRDGGSDTRPPREGGYQGRSEGGYQGRSEGGYQGRSEGGYQGRREGGGGYQGRSEGGYQGRNNDNRGGFGGDRPARAPASGNGFPSAGRPSAPRADNWGNRDSRDSRGGDSRGHSDRGDRGGFGGRPAGSGWTSAPRRTENRGDK